MDNDVYRFYLKVSENTYLVVAGDSVQQTQIKTPLQSSPVDWDSIALQIGRNETNWGIFTKRAVGLTFALDGAKILRSIYYSQGYAGKCILLIEQYNSTTFAYEYWGDADIDFLGAVDEENTITVRSVERGLTEIVNNKKDIPFEIPMDDPQALSVKIDGLKIRNVVSYVPRTYLSQPTNVGAMNLISQFRLSELGVSYMPNGVNSSDNPIPPFFTAATNDIVRVTFTNLKLNYNYNCQIILYKNPGAVELWNHLASADGSEIASKVFNIPMLAGETLRLTVIASVSPVPSAPPGWCEITNISDTQKASLEVEAVLRFAPTVSKAFRFYHFAQKLVSKVTNGQYTLQSNFLSNQSVTAASRSANFDNSPWNTLALPGNSVRGLSGASIITTLGDLFKHCWSMWCLGFGIEGNVLKIEPISYFLNKNLKIATITAVNNIKISTYEDQVFNQIKIGCGSYEYDELSGKDEYNTSRTFQYTAVTVKGQEDDCISPYRWDMFGIEKLRNYLNDQAVLSPLVKTIDNKSDNDTFILEVDPSPVGGYYVPYRAGITTITGITNPESAYNIGLTPGRCFGRHLPRVRSNMPMANKGMAVFQTTDKNSALVSNLSGIPGETMTEKADVNLMPNTYLNRDVSVLWKPFKISSNAVPDAAMRQSLISNKYGYVEIVDEERNRLLKGFVLDVTLKTSNDDSEQNEESDLIMLCHPDTVLN